MTSSELQKASIAIREETDTVLKHAKAGHRSTDELEGEELTYLNPSKRKKDVRKVGAFAGVFVPTCENMWGVLIFLRFYLIVGNAGVIQALGAVFVSFCTAFFTACSMSAMASSGGFLSEGGPYYMISRAMGPTIGATVGLLYWMGISLLAVLETLGAVEAFLIAKPDMADFPGVMQLFGSILLLAMVLMVYCGIRFVTKLGVVFVLVVFYTLMSFYIGLIDTDLDREFTGPPGEVTGLSSATLEHNLEPHYSDGVTFGVVMSWFFPCFTGILSGANRADILRDPPRDLRRGTLGAITFSLGMYSTFMILWGCVAKYTYLRGDWQKEYEASHRRILSATEGVGLAPSLPSTSGIWDIGYNPFPTSIQNFFSNEIMGTMSVTAVSVLDVTGFDRHLSSRVTQTHIGDATSGRLHIETGDFQPGSGEENGAQRRRLAGGSAGAYVFEEISWHPGRMISWDAFKYSPHVGIIFSSISQALQCLIVAPRLLQAIARDNVVDFLAPIAPLSKDHEPIRALGVTYVVCAMLVLIGQLNLVAPLLTMCFLACYINMNVSCWVLTMLKVSHVPSLYFWKSFSIIHLVSVQHICFISCRLQVGVPRVLREKDGGCGISSLEWQGLRWELLLCWLYNGGGRL